MTYYCKKCRKKFKNFEDGVCMPCPDGGEHDICEKRGLSEDERHFRAMGFGPNDYAKTMGLDQDPDWEESYNFDDIGEGE